MDGQGFGNSPHRLAALFNGQMVKGRDQCLFFPYGEGGIQPIDNRGSPSETGFGFTLGSLSEGQVGCHSGKKPLLGVHHPPGY